MCLFLQRTNLMNIMKSLKTALLLFLGVTITAIASVQTATTEKMWHHEPFMLRAGDKLLNTFPMDPGGHAAPYLVDLDGDKRRDLVVGSITGRFRFFKNIGTDNELRFGPDSIWITTTHGDEPARVPNFCCVAAGVQLVDLDKDGVLDLSSGSYYPGLIYWFKGLGNLKFANRQALTDMNQVPILAHPEQGYPYPPSDFGNYMSNIAWVDWNADGLLDMVIGNLPGELMVRLQADVAGGYAALPVPGQPVFLDNRYTILIDGQMASPAPHCAPSIADWDADGLWDILIGTETGEVFWLKNTGSLGKPRFESRERLLGPGVGRFVLKAEEVPGRGIRAQIHAVDVNLDGKMDLLVGDWSEIEESRNGLTAGELQELERHRSDLAALDRSMGFTRAATSYRYAAYSSQGDAGRQIYLEKAAIIERKMMGLLRLYPAPGVQGGVEYEVSSNRQSGHVWVYLRK